MGAEFLSESIQFLKGMGPRRAEALTGAGVVTVRDLLQYYPRRYLDRSTVTPIRTITPEMTQITVVGTIRAMGMVPGQGRKRRFELAIDDGSGTLKCVWFRGLAWIGKSFKTGDRLAVHGKPQSFGGRYTLTHPDFDRLDNDGPALDTGRIIALYPGSAPLERAGVNSRSLRRIVFGLIKEQGLRLTDPMPQWIVDRYDLLDGRVALRAIHLPRTSDELERARNRLKFEELFYIQVQLALIHHGRSFSPGPVMANSGTRVHDFVHNVLPFTLTGDQQKAIEEIFHDLGTGRRMNRLVQGDVGSGKTVVAIAAMLRAIDNGYQAAFMAPTEILAEQHATNLRQYLGPMGLKVHILVGGQKKALRREILEEIADGTAHVVVGTHAVIEDTVVFKNLGLAVVDEQHRFGVMQRARLFDKGGDVHMLLMTATPIPRSLALTLYGDLDVTLIREKPAGRKPIETLLRSEKQREDVYEFVRRELREGRQCYVIYPLVEESEKLDLKDAESGYESLKALFRPYKVDLVHGRMSGWEKDDVMAGFKDGSTDMLVSTTVIEVGVDVPNASVMVIEHAERFGLSQLHQLRGRIGRGTDESTCFLMADYRRTQESEERLATMVATNDGFDISEADLKLRGAGDFFGTRQSGMPDLKIADITEDLEILIAAREAATVLVTRDPQILEEAHGPLREYFTTFFADSELGMSGVG